MTTTSHRKTRIQVLMGSNKDLHKMSSKSLLTEEADSTASSFRLPERGSFRRVVPMDCNSAGVSQVGQAGVAAGPATAAAAKPAPAGNMTFRKLLTCLGLISAAQPASGLYTQGVQITMTVPPYGVSGGVTGQVTGLPGGPGLYKGILLLNGQCNIWWDKSHNAYRFTPDPATAQDAGLVLDEEGRFHLDAGQYETSPYDILAHHMAVFILPKGVPLGWPQYVLENWYIHDYIWNEAVSWLFVDRRGCADANAQCTADNGGYFYAAQQPAGGHGVIPQEEGVHCPATYGPPAQGADIIPGGPVAPVIPQPPQPPVEDVDPEQPSGSDGAGAGDGTGEQEQEQEQEGEGQLTGNGGDSVPLPTPSPTPAESTDQRLRGAASDSLPQLLQLPAPAKVVSLLAAWGVARAGRQQQ